VSYLLVGIGEILWDILPSGKQMGGAPANFAYHASVLGEEGVVVSRVGKDELGLEILNHLRILGLSSDFISLDESYPTGTVTVHVDQDGVPDFTIHEDVAWDVLPETQGLPGLAQRADVVCYGSLAQRLPTSLNTIQKFVSRLSSDKFRIFDINLRQHFYSKKVISRSLKLANILKLNEHELGILSEMYSLEGEEALALKDLIERFDLEKVALTKGSNGSVLYTQDQISFHSGFRVDVVDTVGAGDAFTAAMAIGMLKGFELDRINELANRVASYVCTQPGATPPIPKEIRALFQV
jgi:fructokinase